MDALVGAYRTTGTNGQAYAGRAYLFFGTSDLAASSGATRSPSVTLAPPSDQQYGFFGQSVAVAGDVNGDGLDDALVGAFGINGAEGKELAGRAYLFLGRAGLEALSGMPLTASLALAPPSDQLSGRFGGSVAGACDVNGDGYTDLLIGADAMAGAGRGYLFFGKAGLAPSGGASLTASITLGPLSDLQDVFFGSSAACGDLNGDGLDEALVGADGTVGADGKSFSGRAYVFFGKAGLGPLSDAPLSPFLSLASPSDEENGRFGISLATAETRPSLKRLALSRRVSGIFATRRRPITPS